MRIGIDCRLAGSAHAGIGRYIENLIIRLPHLAPDIEWVYFFHDQAQANEIGSQLISDQVTARVIPIRHYSFQEQSKLAQIFQAAELDLLHVPHFNVPLLYRGPFVVTIHDLLWHEYHGSKVTTLKPWQYWFKYGAYRLVAHAAITRAKRIFVPAETIRSTLEQYYPQTETKTQVTKEGVFTALNLKVDRKKEREKSHPKKRLLYVGSLYPHKNVNLVLNALKQLPEYELLIVGSRNVFQDEFKTAVMQMGLSEQVSILGYKTDQELAILYREVEAVVQPSLSEGFGLTGAEALAAGTPLLASKIKIFEEIYEDAAIFFDPHSAESFIKAVKKLESTDRAQLAKKGQLVISKYSWDTMAKETLQGYLDVVKA